MRHPTRLTAWLCLLWLAGCAAATVPPPMNTDMPPELTADRLITRDGYALPLSVWQPAHAPRGIIIALHSFGDYRRSFDYLGPWLASHGYVVYAWDQRGFGDTPGRGHWPGTRPLVDDLVDAIHLIRPRYPAQLPLYVLGESMGGGVAIIAAASHPDLPVQGLILAAPAVREGLTGRYAWNALIATGATLLPGYRATIHRDPQDPAFYPPSAWRLAEDPLVYHHIRLDTYWGLIRMTDRSSDLAPRLRVPMLLLYGGEDDLVPAVSIHRLVAHEGTCVDYQYLPDAPHLLLHAKHWQAYAGIIRDWLHNEPRYARRCQSRLASEDTSTHGNTGHAETENP